MAEKFVLSKAKEGDWVKFAEDKDCICPMQFKFKGHGADAIVRMPKHPRGARDGIIKAADMVCMTAEEVARNG